MTLFSGDDEGSACCGGQAEPSLGEGEIDGFSVGGDGAYLGIVRQFQSFQRQCSLADGQGRGVYSLFVTAPCGVHGPDAAEITLDNRMEPQHSVLHSELKAAENGHQCEACHAAGVVGAAFDLVPGIAVEAAVPVPDGLDHGDALFDHALGDEQAGKGIFKAVHGFLGVGDGDGRRSDLLGEGADDTFLK